MAKIRRARLLRTGWDDDLLVEEVDSETGDPGGEQVEIEVEACGVCYRNCIDCVGPPTFNASLRSLRTGGHMVLIGNVIQEKAELNLGYLITSGIWLLGSSGATREHMKDVFELHAERPFRVHLHERLDLADADRAQRAVQAGGLRGRIVLLPH
jgi:D-arabinose 1-dehydrogenase-like Zn-dependent alcohol dehydrogenase